MVRKDSGIDSLEDLRGKKVATNAVGGSTDYLQDFYIEEQAGLKPGRDYEKVEVPFGQMQETLLSGRVDMGLFPQPFYGAVNATGEVKPMFRLTDQIEPFVQIMNGCRRDFVEENEAAMRAFQEDWARIADWMTEPGNRDEVIAASAAATKIPAEVLDRFLLTKQDYFRPANGAVSVDALQEEWDFFRERGGIEQELKVTDHVIDDLLPPAEPKIATRGLRKVYATRRGAVTAIDGLDFRAAAGEFVSIVGPSGCGKSTFLYILGGFVEASAGEATVDGVPIAGPDPARGIVFQEFVLFPWRTVLGNVGYGLAERGVAAPRAGDAGAPLPRR